jgi:peptide/nickel transport system substrate-binding protein
VKLAFRLKKENPNPLMVVHWLTLNVVLPQHVWEPLLAQVNGDFAELLKLKVDRNPVGSGPYRLLSYSAEKIVLERDDGYWGNAALHGGRLPAPRFIVAPIFKSNDHYSMALQQGRLDAANTFIPRIWLKARKGVRTWYDEAPYFAPGSIPTAFINHLRPPLDNVHFRRAMAYAINYDDIRELAVSGYSVPHEPGFILPFGPEGKYFSKEDAQRYGTRFDPEAARAELTKGGYSPVFRGEELVEVRDRSGARLPTLFIQCPTGWSDWESIVRIMVRGMRRAGIDVREQFVDTSAYYRALPIADFDLILSTPSSIPSPAEPWTRFDALLNSRDWAPPGDRMFGNYGRFNRPGSPGYLPRVDELLQRIPVVTDEAERSTLYRELNRLCMELQPALPLVYRPKSFYEFNTRHWEGFPTAANPFLPPYVPVEGPGILTLWHLRPVTPR